MLLQSKYVIYYLAKRNLSEKGLFTRTIAVMFIELL